MQFREFTETVAENIKDYLPEKYENAEVKLTPTEKNNGLILTGLTVKLAEENVSPCIYLNGYYDDLQAGRDLDEILQSIAQSRVEHVISEKLDVTALTDFEKVKDRIMFKVIGSDSNEARLGRMPHRIENDMALIYHITLHMDDTGLGSVPITNSLMDTLGVNEEVLHDLAMENTLRELPTTFRSMKEVMKEMFIGNLPEMQGDEEMEDFLQALLSEDDDAIQDEHVSMYVLSNSEKMNGAAVLFYPGIKEQIAEQLESDFFVLPSSIHETLIIPDNGRADAKELQDMVREVNATQVAPDEVLTGNVYFYDKESKVFSLAEDREALKAEQKVEKPSIMDKLKENKDKVSEALEGRLPVTNKSLAPEM